MPRQAILYLSHVVNRAHWRAYKRLECECRDLADVYYLLNLSCETVPADMKNMFPITPSKRAALGHPSREGNVGWWMDTSASHTRVMQSGIDRALLAFRKIKPEYDYYWIVEYDVEFSGHWSEPFNAFADNTSDLLCTNMFRRETNPTWAWWQSLVWPPQSKPDLIRAFLPFARLSARAIDTLIAAGQDGIDGIYELVWPTVLHHHKLTIEDIGGDGSFVSPANVNRWYTSTITSESLSPGTFVFRPNRYRVGRIPNKLWHPVKRGFVRHALGRLISRISPSLY
jgi:hypothetical protein